jgi:uncharacterized protein YbjT (DUF2867 family)
VCTGTNDERLQIPLVDFDKLENHASLFRGVDSLFYCLGSTRKRAGSFAEFQKIEWALATSVLSSAKAAGIPQIILLSSKGANPDSFIGYLRVKGLVERFASDQNFKKLIIARPSLLMGERGESRMLEGLSMSLSKPLLKPFQKYYPSVAPIQDHALAQALLKAAHNNAQSSKRLLILENSDLLKY